MKTHNVAFHVYQNDKGLMNLALNNIENMVKHYEAKDEKVTIELIAYGPGLNIFIDGKSPVVARIEAMSLGIENLTFAAFGNTHSKMSKKTGKEIKLLDGVTMTSSGVVRLVELQEQGYAFIRP